MSMLRTIREKKGLTVSQLAARASIPSRVIGDYEEGRSPIPLAHAKLLAKALWVPIEDLMPPAGSVPPSAQTPGPRAQQQQAIDRAQPAPANVPSAVTQPAPATENGHGAGISRGPARDMSGGAHNVQTQPQRARPPGSVNVAGEGQRGARPTRAARVSTPLTEGQLQELTHLSQRLQISREKLEERVGKALTALSRPEAKEWIKRLRAMADEIAPTQKIRFGQWPEAQEDLEAAYLREQRDAGAAFTFKLFNGEQITGTILDFTPYTITVKADDGEETVLRKLAIAYYRRQTLSDAGSPDQTADSAPDTVATPLADQSAHVHERDDRHQAVGDSITSDHAGAPDAPEEDDMDRDRGA